jgi:hypothetical protein
MCRFRSVVALCALAAGTVFWLVTGGATAGALREVKVSVQNNTTKTLKILVYEAETQFLVHWRHKGTFVLHPGRGLVAESGTYSDRHLVIATSQCEQHRNGMHGIAFHNPFIGYPDAQTVLYEEGSGISKGEWFWRHPGRGGSHSFDQGATHEFWEKAVSVTRHADSEHYIDFTEHIVRHECSS